MYLLVRAAGSFHPVEPVARSSGPNYTVQPTSLLEKPLLCLALFHHHVPALHHPLHLEGGSYVRQRVALHGH
jgi:hypothetical protein